MKKIFLLLIIMLNIHLATAQDELFVPFDKGDTEMPMGVEYFWAKTYTEYLKALNENKIASIKTDKEIYRFLWLRTFDNPIVIRIEKDKNKTHLFWKRSNGEGGFDPGIVVEDKSIELTKKQWKHFKKLLKKSKFWQNPSIIIEEGFGVLDGSEWVLEGIQNNNYHISKVDIFEPCVYLIELTKMNIPKDEFY